MFVQPVTLAFEFLVWAVIDGLSPEYTIEDVVGYEAKLDFLISQTIVAIVFETTYQAITSQLYPATLNPFLPVDIKSGEAST